MSFSNSRRFRFALLFTLAMTELMPLALVMQTIPVLLRRSGASLQQIGLVFLAYTPWTLKALWAPLVDKLGARSSLGRYRGWLLVMHPLLLLTVVLGSFVDLPALLMTNRTAGMAGLFFLTIISATADTASHGMAVNLLSADERGVGNGYQTAGAMTGIFIGGGLAMVLIDKIGWQGAVLMIAAFILLSLVGIILYKERPMDSSQKTTVREALLFFRQPRLIRWLIVVAAVSASARIMYPSLNTMLVDHGISLTTIGLVTGLVANAAGIFGGLLGGFATKHLGRQRAFYALLLFFCLCCVPLLAITAATGRPVLYLASVLPTAGMAAQTTIVLALMMDRSRSHMAGTDYTVQYSLATVCESVGMNLGAQLGGRFGSATVFALTPALTLMTMLLSAWLLERRDFQPALPDREPEPAPDPLPVHAMDAESEAALFPPSSRATPSANA